MGRHRLLWLKLMTGVAPAMLGSAPAFAQQAAQTQPSGRAITTDPQNALSGPAAPAASASPQDRSTTPSSGANPDAAVQATSPADTNGRTATAGVQDIIVTANRQAQNLQRVSAAVQVVDGAKLREQGLSNISQVFQNTPSVQVTAQPAGFNVDIRGQGGDLPASSGQGSVALEFDGVYNIQSQAATIGFYDLDRVEVLPGPQSTRYGPNADGGIVNVITHDPVLGDSSGYASLTGGSYGLFRGEAAQNIPVTDTLAIRVAAAGIRRDSYYKPQGADAIAESGRIKILFKPSDTFSFKVEYAYDHIGGTGAGAEPRSISHVAPYAGGSINDIYSNPWDHGDYSTGCGTTGTDNVGTCDVSANHASINQHTLLGVLSYRPTSWAVLDVSGSYIRETGNQVTCWANGSPWAVGGVHNCFSVYAYAPFYEVSSEVRLHNAPGSAVIWNLGYYHFEVHSGSWSTSVPKGIVASPAIAAYNATITNAVFGDVTYPVFGGFRLIAGLRGSSDQRQYIQGNGNQTEYFAGFHHVDYRVGQEYDISPTSMEYLTVSTGYRPGGISIAGTTEQVFKSEVNTAFELGVKNRFFDNKLQVNADLFYYNQKNYQDIDAYGGFYITLPTGASYFCSTGGPIPNPPQCAVPTFSLQAHSFGAETQIRFAPTRDDTFGVTATYLDARFNKNQGTCATLGLANGNPPVTLPGCYDGYSDQNDGTLKFFNLAGAVQPHSPKIATTFTYTHIFRFSSGASLSVGGDAFHSSGYWVHPVQDAEGFGYQPSYWQENIQATFAPKSTHFSLSAFVRNLSNYAVKQSTLPITLISDPRTYGATVGLKW